MKNGIAAAVVLLLIAGAFWGGMAYAEASKGTAGAANGAGGFAGGAGPAANLTEEQMAEMESMSQEERRAFMQEQLGGEMPATGAAGGARGARGGLIEGEIIEADDDTITIALADGGSQVIYLDDETAIGYVQGVSEISPGANATVLATPEADGVTTAQAIVVE